MTNHDSDCSINNRGCPEILGPCDCPAKAAPVAEAVDVVAHMYQHDETGRVGFVDQQQVDWGFEKNNPRLYLCGELMTVAQHGRIMATAPPHDAELVELLRATYELCTEREMPSETALSSLAERIDTYLATLPRT